MAVDQTLIQGAGAVAQADAAKIGATAVGVGSMIDSITSVGQKLLDKRVEAAKVYDEKAQAVLDASGELPADEYDALYDNLQTNRDMFISGSRKDKALLTRDLNMKAQDVGEYKEFRTELADLKLNDTDGFSQSFIDSPEGEAYFNLLEDKSSLVQNDKGRLGVMMPGSDGEEVFTEISKLKDTIQKNRVDTASRDLLQVYANKNMQLSSQVAHGQKLDFPFEAQKNQLKTNLIGKSQNKMSLFYDEIIPGQPFAANFIDELQKNTYKDLGVELKDMDGDGQLDEADAELIFKELIKNDSNTANELLANYFTKHLQNNFESGTALRVKPDEGFEIKTNTQTGNDAFIPTREEPLGEY